MKMNEVRTIRAGVAGAAGYTGGEMIRLLLDHPFTDLVYASSRSQAGNPLAAVHEDLLGRTELTFRERYPEKGDLDVLFLCLPHGTTGKFLEHMGPDSDLRIIDLSSDHRLEAHAGNFVYGLPEFQREVIQAASHIANPGCFATAIQLALLPLAAAGLPKEDIHISAITGSTGAGGGLLPTTHFTWRNNNVSVYKAFTHQHLAEIGRTIHQLQPSYSGELNFIPYRGDFARGIIATVYTDYPAGLEEARQMYGAFYSDAPFTRLAPGNVHLKQVVNTNYCNLHLEKHGNKLMIISVIDNLLKGASGQALQNLNLVMGWPETTGLLLKASVY